jgi:hypothetical protein
MKAIIAQILAIPTVILLFKFLPRWSATLTASLVFVVVAVISMIVFYKSKGFKSYSFWVWSVFLYALVIPILAIRLAAGLFFDGSVEEAFPIVGILHRISSPYYILAIVTSVLEWLKNKKAAL